MMSRDCRVMSKKKEGGIAKSQKPTINSVIRSAERKRNEYFFPHMWGFYILSADLRHIWGMKRAFVFEERVGNGKELIEGLFLRNKAGTIARAAGDGRGEACKNIRIFVLFCQGVQSEFLI